MPEFKLIHL